jgi:CheY-like chemotaxis protein
MAEPLLAVAPLLGVATTPPSFRGIKPAAPPPARILVVEDERLVAKGIVRSLEALGYVIAGNVASSDDALRCAAQCKPELILMDIGIKGRLDGIEAARELRLLHPTPIVYLTGNSDDETLRRALETEAQGYLLKPFSERALRASIEMALYNHSVQQQLYRANVELMEGRRELERRAHETRNLSQLGEALQSCDNVDEAYAVVSRSVPRLFPEDNGVICFLDPSRTFLEAIASWGPESPTPVFPPEDCRALRQGRPYRWGRSLDDSSGGAVTARAVRPFRRASGLLCRRQSQASRAPAQRVHS